ncbi:MAG: Omp28-related outer membrane protein, partial [Luteibaculum sp.]
GQQHAGHTQITSKAIDCSGQDNVFLVLEQYFRVFQTSDSECHIEISTDNMAWTSVYTNDIQTPIGQVLGLDISNIAANQAEVYIRFRFQSQIDYYWIIDEVKVLDPVEIELELLSVSVDPYVVAPGQANIEVKVRNGGSGTITDANLFFYTTDSTQTTGGSVSLNIGPFGSKTITLPNSLPVDVPGKLEFTVMSDLADANLNNQKLGGFLYGLSFLPKKVVAFEEATGTWCGWCPRGTVNMDELHDRYPETTALIAVHNNDPMVVSAYDSWMGQQISGYPSGLIDRHPDPVDPGNFVDEYASFLQKTGPAELTVSAGFDGATRKVSIDVTTIFATPMNDEDFRIALVVTENGVTGTGSAWNQRNYYAGGGRGPMGGYENLPDPVPAAQMVYEHVARAIIGGATGKAGVIPTEITANTEYLYNASYTVPASYDVNEMEVIALLINNATGEIVGTGKAPVAAGTGIKQYGDAKFIMGIQNNPFEDVLKVNIMSPSAGDITFTLFDAMGRAVMNETRSVNQGDNAFAFDNLEIPNGVYTLTANMGTLGTMVERVVAK